MIEAHAATCDGEYLPDLRHQIDVIGTDDVIIVPQHVDDVMCPMCGKLFDAMNIELHADSCVDLNEGSTSPIVIP